MKTDDIKILLEKYYVGETTLEEELLLRNFFSKDNIDPTFEDDKQLFAIYADAGKEEAPFEFVPTDEPKKKVIVEKRLSVPWYYTMAASVSLLAVGIVIGWWLGSGRNQDEMIALRQDISEIKAMTVVSRLNAESASDRILAAYELSGSDDANIKTISALIHSMTMDDNVNVRIAAADALFRFGNKEEVRNGFIKALNAEKDPNLQIRLINMLVNLQEKRALPKLKEMMGNTDHMQVVRETAAHGVTQLL